MHAMDSSTKHPAGTQPTPPSADTDLGGHPPIRLLFPALLLVMLLAALTALAQRFLAVGQRYPWFPPLWVRDVISEGGVLRQRMLERLGREHQEKAHTAIARWQREGRLNPALEPSLLFQSLMGLTLLPLATSQMWRGDAEKPRVGVEEIARHAVALITQGVGPGPAARIEKD